ncbi:hypothetical protein AOLI_G00325820 [Acnodon oligacanthus]
MSRCWRSRPRACARPCLPGRGSVVLRVLEVLWFSVCLVRSDSSVVVQKDAQFGVSYLDTVTSHNQTIYSFNHTVSRNKTEGVRVSVELLSETAKSPILFVVRQKQAVLSFQVPLILRGLYQRKYQYTQVGRTLCQPPTLVASETQFFYVDVSTLSSTSVHYQLRVSRVESFTLQTDKKFSFNATPSQPQFFKYVFPDGVDTVIVKVNSEKNFPCSVMSIQDIQCPVYDLDNNVAFIGMYQTMTKKGAVTVQRKDFPSNSFYVVVVVKTEDEACGGPLKFYPLLPDELLDAGIAVKLWTLLSLLPSTVTEVYVMGMLFCLGIFLSFYVLTFLVACIENKRMNRKREGFLQPADMSPAETDTSFMYMIAGLCMLKLYQKRHLGHQRQRPIRRTPAWLPVIFFSVLGVVFGKGNTAFWIVFSVIHILATLLLSTQLYYMGRWKLDSGILRRMLYVIYTDCVRQCSGTHVHSE